MTKKIGLLAIVTLVALTGVCFAQGEDDNATEVALTLQDASTLAQASVIDNDPFAAMMNPQSTERQIVELEAQLRELAAPISWIRWCWLCSRLPYCCF